MAWGDLFVILKWFTPEQKIKRTKEKITKLENEKYVLTHKTPSVKNSVRVHDIDSELKRLQDVLKDNA